MLTAVRAWQEALSKEVADRFGAALAPADIPFTFPPKPAQGDAATPVAFALAKTLRRPPKEVAEALAGAALPGVRETQVAGGYLNLYVDRGWALTQLLTGRFVPAAVPGKVVVEHTNINPNKAAHVGHLRNAVLGDTLVRCLRATGRTVEVQNYIDDTGVQVADVAVGFRQILGFGPAQLEALIGVYERFAPLADASPGGLERLGLWLKDGSLGNPSEALALFPALRPVLDDAGKSNLFLGWLLSSAGRFDAFCWELYARVANWYAEDESRAAVRQEALHDIERGGNPTATMAERLAAEMVGCHLRTMLRLDVRYDVLPHESDILKTGFWAACFESLKASGAIHRLPEDAPEKNRGCWVMALTESDEFAGLSDADKVIVRSNGTVTYVGKDMAYQLWKFGLLGRDFQYRPFALSPYPLWRSCHDVSAPGAPSFGHGERVVNVIDVRQSYLQKVVKEGLRQMGHTGEADRSVHFAYEMVALSQKAAQELEARGQVRLSDEDRGKAYVEMSGRKGLGVQADVLLDLLEERAAAEVLKREPELDPAEAASRARDLARGALRYYMVRFNKNQVVAFDFEQALAFEGETGPYLQYACVRAEGILRKAAAQGLAVPDPADPAALAEALASLDEEAWGVLTLFLRVPMVVEQAVEALDLNLAARQLYVAAGAFHTYYHGYPVLQEPDPAKRSARLLTVALFAKLLRQGLQELLGIPVPERM